MTEIVTAVYEKGLLRPLQPLRLRERQTVRIQVLSDESPVQDALDDGGRNEVQDKVEEIISNLVAAGFALFPKEMRFFLIRFPPRSAGH